MKRALIACLAAALVCVAMPAAAQTGQTTGTISGRVMYNDEGMPGVTIQISSPALQGDKVVVSQANGDYISPFLPPGSYTVTFSLEGFKTQTAENVSVLLGQVRRLDAQMVDESFEGQIEVVGASETVSQQNAAQTTVPLSFQEKLAIPRTITQATLLVAGTQNTGPNNNISISGAQSFENLWTINGVVVNENVRGQSLPLYIEDAVLETTTSTSGISAQYGRFQGGVVNMLTKSGGNRFSGSFRAVLTNDKWISKNELSPDRVDDINTQYEATFGGYVLKDALWFFLAGRQVKSSESRTTDYTLLPYTFSNDQKRYEGKLTWSITDKHRLVGAYTEIKQTTQNSDFGTILDFASLNPNRQDPEDMLSFNYTGVFTQNFFLEGLYSERNYTIGVGSGSPYTDVIRGTLLLDRSRGSARYHTPTFCSAPDCQEEQRNNENWYVKGSYFLSSERAGTHDLVFGVDQFKDVRIQDNHQQGSDFRIYGSAAIILDDDSIYPVFAPDGRFGGRTTYYRWTPIFGPPNATNFNTDSLYANDTWRLNNKWSFNIGLRYDKNDGTDGSGTKVADDSRISPRLGATYDVKGDGDWQIHAGYAQYVGLLANTVADSASDAGSPAWTYGWYYGGPCVNCEAYESGDYSNLVSQDDAIAIWYDWFVANGGTDDPPNFQGGSFPGYTPIIPNSLKSPYTDELSLGVTKRLGNRGVVRVDLVDRSGHDFYVSNNAPGRIVTTDFGADLDLAYVTNDDAGYYTRDYFGVLTTFQYRLGTRWNFGATYTWSKAKGNFDGETASSGPVAGSAFEYMEYKEPEWNTPSGWLEIDQRNKLRAWAVWDVISTKHNSLSVSGLYSYWTGGNFSAGADVTVDDYVTNPGYATPPAEEYYYFGPRGGETWDNISRFDIGINYGFTIGGVELFVQFDMLNVFNWDGQDGGNTTVNTLDPFNPFTEQPVQGVNWDYGSSWREPTSEGSFQNPREYDVSLGVRF